VAAGELGCAYLEVGQADVDDAVDRDRLSRLS
jgi:hypothetical protein